MKFPKAVLPLCAAALALSLSPRPCCAQGAAPLTFDQAAKLLLESNPQARAAALAADSAYSRLAYARAGLLPQFSANAAYSRVGGDLSYTDESYSYGLSAIPAAVRSARASWDRAAAERDLVGSGLLYELKVVFADLAKARETLKLSEETLKRREENVEIIRIKYEAGRENKAALLETQSVQKTSRWQHENYKKELRLLERKLNRLLARSPSADAAVTALPDPPAPPEDLGAYSAALARHPSLRSARAALQAGQAAVDSSKSAFLPEASASGRYGWSGSDWPDKTKSWSAGVSLSLPLFTGGKLSANLDSARADKARAEASLKDTADEVYLNAEDAFLSLRQAWSYLDVVQSSLEAANARAWLLRKQYLAGQASYFEWRNVEEQFIGAENQLLSARRNLAAAHAAFLRALGE